MIFDDSGDALFPGEMMLRGETIEAVARGDERIDSAGAEVIDGGGRTLMSGMVEAHAHLTWPSSIKRVINAMKVPLDKDVAITERNAQTTLHAGFTSAYSAGSLGETIEPALRDRIDAGLIPELLLRAPALEKGTMGVMGVREGQARHPRASRRLIMFPPITRSVATPAT